MKVRPHVLVLWVLVGVLALLIIMAAIPAYAAVVGEWRVTLKRGTGIFDTITGQTEQEAWDSCHERIAAQPPSSSTWTCQTMRYVARVVADPPSVCTVPQPAPATETRQCPDGTVGSWTQTQAFVSAPYPTCWTAGPWVPAEAPLGACTIPPPPPPTGDWVHCANQAERCEFVGARVVRYGADIRWTERSFVDGVQCDNTAFGNPAPGALKTCQTRGAVTPPPTEPPPPPPPPATGTATLTWTPVLTMTDGTPATLSGFRIRYTQASGDILAAPSVDVPDANATTHTVTGLASGTWHFAVSSLTATGPESLPSNVASKVIQ